MIGCLILTESDLTYYPLPASPGSALDRRASDVV